MRRLRDGAPALLRAAAPAALLGAVGLLSGPVIDRLSPIDRPLDTLGVSLMVVAAAALLERRSKPVIVLAVTAACASVYLGLGYPYGPILVSLAVSVYAVARWVPTRVAVGCCAAALAVLLLHLVTSPATSPGLLGVVPGSAWVALPATAGSARRLVAEARRREQSERESRLLDAERLRLAHDVHDVVGHGLAAIGMQADIALHLRQTRPAQAYQALAAISRASADALTELRTTLATLTTTSAPGSVRTGPADDHDGATPARGLADLPGLGDRMRAAGIGVDVTISGEPRPLPSAIDLAAYRVLQEGLTNVVKHAAGAAASVRLHYRADTVHLTVTNPIAPTDPASVPPPPDQTAVMDGHEAVAVADGLGLAGMHRRVHRVGGALVVRSSSDPPVFTVAASFPVAPTAPATSHPGAEK